VRDLDRAGVVQLLTLARDEVARLRAMTRTLKETNDFLRNYAEAPTTALEATAGANAVDAFVNRCADDLAKLARAEITKEHTTLFSTEQLSCSFAGFVQGRDGELVALIRRIMARATRVLGRASDDGEASDVTWKQNKCVALCLAAMLEQLAGNQFRFDCVISFLLFLVTSVGTAHRDETIKLFSRLTSGSIASMMSINNILKKNYAMMRDITSPAAASSQTTVQCYDNGPGSTAQTKKYIAPTSRNNGVRQTSTVTYRMTLVLLDTDIPPGILANPRSRIDPSKLRTMACDELQLTAADKAIRTQALTALGVRALQIITHLGVDEQGDVQVGDPPPAVPNGNLPKVMPRARRGPTAVDTDTDPPGFAAAVPGAAGAAGAMGAAHASGAYPPSTVRTETQSVIFVNPGSRENQDLVMNQCKFDHRVAGAAGVRSSVDNDAAIPVPEKSVVLFSMDKGATPLGTALWDSQAVYLLAGLHVGFAVEHIIATWLKEMDNAKAGTIPLSYGFCYKACRLLYGDGCDHHKFDDFEDALSVALMAHLYSMAIKQRACAGDPIDLAADGAVAELNKYVTTAGGGVQFESVLSFLVDVLIVQRGLRASIAGGPTMFDASLCWLKCLVPVLFAAGSHRMAPEVTYFLLAYLVCYKDNPDMQLVLRRTFSMRTENAAERGASHQCGDALMENRVQAATRCMLSPSVDGINCANYLSGGPARHNKSHVYAMLGVKQQQFKKRPRIDQHWSTVDMVRALNAGEGGLHRDPEHPKYGDYVSFDSKVQKDRKVAIHEVVAWGQAQADQFLVLLKDGERDITVTSSLFAQRDASKVKQAKDAEKEEREEEEAQALRELDAEFEAAHNAGGEH